MPYRKKEPNLEWTKYNHKMKGLVTKEDSERQLTDEQRAAMTERLRSAREKRAKVDETAEE
jgi:hypothetical protein